MVPGIGHDLAIAGVVGSFDRNDAIADFRVLFAEIFGEFCLGAGRSNDQDCAGKADGVHHLREKLLVGRGMPAADRVGLVVKVFRGHVWMHNDFVFAGQADMEYLGLRMVDPDDRMEMCCHVLVPLGRDQLACIWVYFRPDPRARGIFNATASR